MPTPVAHSLAGTMLALLSSKERADPKFLVACVVAACFADIDFGIGFFLGRNVHHYFTHSLGFTLLFLSAVYLLARTVGRDRPERDAMLLGAAYLSHVLLDMLSKDSAPPYGLELLWPLSEKFYISPILVFDDIWRGSLAKLFSLHNWLAVAREVLLTGPPTAVVLWWRRRQEYS